MSYFRQTQLCTNAASVLIMHHTIVLCMKLQCAPEDERYSFHVEWYDHGATLVRKYLFHFYESDSTVEMVIDILVVSGCKDKSVIVVFCLLKAAYQLPNDCCGLVAITD